MTGVLAQIGSFFNTLLGTGIAHAAGEDAAHGSSIHVVLKAEQIGSFFGFPITNSLLLTFITTSLLIGFALYFRKKIAMIPGKLQAGVEMLFEGVLDY
ncbi:MAG: hypothetical protein Q8K68_00360, partial [Nitrospirota bacterium]|nr:hypothetical protein [Nitrospirota bacterium]